LTRGIEKLSFNGRGTPFIAIAKTEGNNFRFLFDKVDRGGYYYFWIRLCPFDRMDKTFT